MSTIRNGIAFRKLTRIVIAIIILSLLWFSYKTVWVNFVVLIVALILGCITQKREKPPVRNDFFRLPALFYFIAIVLSMMLGSSLTKKIHIVQSYFLPGHFTAKDSEGFDEDGVRYASVDYNFTLSHSNDKWKMTLIAICFIVIAVSSWFYSIIRLITLKES